MGKDIKSCLIGVNYKSEGNSVTEASYKIIETLDNILESYSDVNEELTVNDYLICLLSDLVNDNKYEYIEFVNFDGDKLVGNIAMVFNSERNFFTLDVVEHEYRFITGCATGVFINTVCPKKSESKTTNLLNMLYFEPNTDKELDTELTVDISNMSEIHEVMSILESN